MDSRGRARTMARATARARGSSPSSATASASASSSHVLTIVGGRQLALRIHAHVERTRLAEAETALGGVELEGAHAQVEQQRIGSVPAFDGERRSQGGEGAGTETHPIAEAGEPLARDVESVRVAVDPQQRGVRRGGEHRRGMPAETDGGIDETGTRPGAQPPHDLPHHHRHMGGAHRPGVRLSARHRRFVATPRRSAPRRHPAPLSRSPPRRSLASSLAGSEVESGEELLVVQDLVLVLTECPLPDLLVPDAELVDIAGDHHATLDTGVVTQQRREQHPPLAVEHQLVRARDVDVAEADVARIEAVLGEQLPSSRRHAENG